MEGLRKRHAGNSTGGLSSRRRQRHRDLARAAPRGAALWEWNIAW